MYALWLWQKWTKIDWFNTLSYLVFVFKRQLTNCLVILYATMRICFHNVDFCKCYRLKGGQHHNQRRTYRSHPQIDRLLNGVALSSNRWWVSMSNLRHILYRSMLCNIYSGNLKKRQCYRIFLCSFAIFTGAREGIHVFRIRHKFPLNYVPKADFLTSTNWCKVRKWDKTVFKFSICKKNVSNNLSLKAKNKSDQINSFKFLFCSYFLMHTLQVNVCVIRVL